jgi:isopenicillin N synthase-like dioxygenase
VTSAAAGTRPPASLFTVPRVDLADDPPDAIVDALIESSCAFVVNHGVSEALIGKMIAASAAFFDLPGESKLTTRWPGDGLWRGWQPVYEGAQDLTGGRVPDLLERYEIQLAGLRGDTDGELAALRDSFALWPAAPATFADVWTRYYVALGKLASQLIGRIAAALTLPSELMPAWCEEHFANLVAINYIEQKTRPEPGQLRIRAHTDRGGLTLLWADQSPGGLEVMLPHSRTWVPVMIPPDAFLVQAGDLLTRWTNRVIKPNIHRVVNPPADVAATSRRLSIPYFHYPRLDTVVEAAPSCLTPARRAPSPVVAGDHIFRRQEDYKGDGEEGVEEALAGED